MTRTITPRTNGDRLEPALASVRAAVGRLCTWARDNPDEVAVSVAPWLLLAAATRRHRLSYTEAVIVGEVAYWGGAAMCGQYRQWKTRPAWPSLREVV